tara:strand:- start:332 stop:592 length:261 start_codon:yes stop_codon:yes gene_type:complete
MTNKEILKKQIIYRSQHRGNKEMDILLGSFVNEHIEHLKYDELNELLKLLSMDDEIIQKWYFEKKSRNPILKSNLSNKLKKFKPKV